MPEEKTNLRSLLWPNSIVLFGGVLESLEPFRSGGSSDTADSAQTRIIQSLRIYLHPLLHRAVFAVAQKWIRQSCNNDLGW